MNETFVHCADDVSSGNGFERSLSVPASHRRNRKGFAFLSGNNSLEPQHESQEQPQLGDAASRNPFTSRSLKGLRSSRKADIRVSRFEPMGINIPDDVMLRMRNVEERSLFDAVKASNIANGKPVGHNVDEEKKLDKNDNFNRKSFKSKRKAQGNVNGLVKLLQGGVKRIGSAAPKQESTCCIIKTVEIVRNPHETLGIFIKKQKVSLETETAMQSGFDPHKRSHNSREGIFISKLAASSEVAKQQLVRVGDEILAVNTVHVSSLDVQMVATMMCVLKRLILTIRTLQNNITKPCSEHTSQPITWSAPHLHITECSEKDHPARSKVLKSSSMASLPEHATLEATIERSSDISCTQAQILPVRTAERSNDDTVLHSPISVSSSASDSSIQSKFDESFQILLDAIAGCEKQKTFTKKDTLHSVKDALHHANPVNSSNAVYPCKHAGLVQNMVATASADNSLLNEILRTVGHGDNWNGFLPEQESAVLESRQQHIHMRDTRPASHTIPEFVDMSATEGVYDELPISDAEQSLHSDTSSIHEVNLDELDLLMIPFKPQENSVGFLMPPNTYQVKCGNSKSVENIRLHDMSQRNSDVDASTNVNGTGIVRSHASDSDICRHDVRPTMLNGDEAYAESNVGIRVVPRFPVDLNVTSPSVINMVQPLISVPSGNNSITVDKKREWLQSGKIVSDELKRRLDVCVLAHDETNQHHLNQQVTKTVNSSTTSGYKQPGFEFPLRSKASLKSPVEKCAKSLLAVSSPTNTSPPAFFPTASTQDNVNEEKGRDYVRRKSSVDSSAVNETHSGSKEELSVPSSKGTTVKITSPGRSRRKNWSRKFTKKFKIMGNSDAASSDYSCWTAEDVEDLPQPTLAAEENLPKVMNRRESVVLNRYHLDISMAHQRRLSRQLYLDNRARDSPHRALSLSQFQKYKPLPVLGRAAQPVDGCLVITLYGVKELKKSLCEAYCIVQVDDASTKRIGTTMQTCKGSTTWNQCFEMVVKEARDLYFTVYTWDTRGGKHKAASQAVLNLPTLMFKTKSRFRYSDRLAVSLEPRGLLYIRIALERSSNVSDRMLFGADLQSIAEREKSDDYLPTLVKSCIKEVEKRGMHVVGVYRLCGSAIVKKDLRAKLEQSDGDVDLSSSSYPDINVITGILKDFLRELPQPLFPPELLEAVTMVMDKHPGPTPTVMVKHAFAPNPSLSACSSECGSLPDPGQEERTEALLQQIEAVPSSPVERATLYALINHLKKVSVHSNRNKMICQNLAVCFGPVLLGPVNAAQTNGLDLDAAIGFKRHIQVLNYMISNWPLHPVIYKPMRWHVRNTAVDKESHRVSLTRRLSRVYVADDVEEKAELIMFSEAEPSDHVSLAGIPETADGFTDPALYCEEGTQAKRTGDILR